jgi:hypothetical protein
MTQKTTTAKAKMYAYLWLSDFFLSIGSSSIAFGFSALFLGDGATSLLTNSEVLRFGIGAVIIGGAVMLPASAICKGLALIGSKGGDND